VRQGRPCDTDAHTTPSRVGGLFTRRAFSLLGSSGENVSPQFGAGGGGVPVELHPLDVRGLQPFRTGLHFEADSCAFL
jgi:hypothetical protein